MKNEPREKFSNPPGTPCIFKNAKKSLFKNLLLNLLMTIIFLFIMLVEDVEFLRKQKAKKKTSKAVTNEESNAGIGFKSKTKRSKIKNDTI